MSNNKSHTFFDNLVVNNLKVTGISLLTTLKSTGQITIPLLNIDNVNVTGLTTLNNLSVNGHITLSIQHLSGHFLRLITNTQPPLVTPHTQPLIIK